jgi:hypothetical protein
MSGLPPGTYDDYFPDTDRITLTVNVDVDLTVAQRKRISDINDKIQDAVCDVLDENRVEWMEASSAWSSTSTQ